MANLALTLSKNDPAVIAAYNAEQRLFAHYGLQAKDHYVTLPDQNIKIRISEIGTGKPVFIVPGNTGDVFPLAGLLAELKGRRIIALNRPGGGLSEGMDHRTVDIRRFAVQTIITAMDAFQLDRVDVIAHSMGAHWSLWTAMDQPHRVRTLTMLGNPGNVMKGKPPFMMRILARPPFDRLLIKLIKGPENSTKLTMLKTMGSSEKLIESLPNELGEAYYYFKRLPHYDISFTSLLQNMAPTIDAQQLSQVKQPSQLLLGDKDTFITVAGGKDIVAAMPASKLHVLAGASHLPWLESLDECGKLIMDFLEK